MKSCIAIHSPIARVHFRRRIPRLHNALPFAKSWRVMQGRPSCCMASPEAARHWSTSRCCARSYSGVDEQLTAQGCIESAKWTTRLLERVRLRDVVLVGPAPCPIDKIKDRWRWHFLLKSSRASTLTRLARYVAEKCPVARDARLRLVVDRDPVALL